MASASDYVRSLRLHVAVHRLSSDDLRSGSASSSSVPTLFRGHITISHQERDLGDLCRRQRRRGGQPQNLGRAQRRRPRLDGILSPHRVSDLLTSTLVSESYTPASDESYIMPYIKVLDNE
ncbi:hypothetical protein QJS10_CPA09g01919 [Acorus calamus]|uniref:Uncharacterized protein n=1 Tax=Acorus calamus TaxID=4465 RepID=A0AAV9E8B1_ACOCL|nr:hypothetical protein QJS10_CPA09g01919 [Acorus calamus]